MPTSKKFYNVGVKKSDGTFDSDNNNDCTSGSVRYVCRKEATCGRK
jgi:hypothetical protein